MDRHVAWRFCVLRLLSSLQVRVRMDFLQTSLMELKRPKVHPEAIRFALTFRGVHP